MMKLTVTRLTEAEQARTRKFAAETTIKEKKYVSASEIIRRALLKYLDHYEKKK